MTGGARSRRVDILGEDSGIEQLASVSFDEIEKQFHRQFAVARGASSKKKQRIFFADGIGFFHLAEESCGVGELSLELRAHFSSCLITARPDARADGGDQIPRVAREMLAEFADSFFNDALDGAAPSGVENTDCTALSVSDDDGNAIGGEYGQEQSRSIGDEAVAGKWVLRDTIEMVDQVGMNLTERDKRPEFAGVHRSELS